MCETMIVRASKNKCFIIIGPNFSSKSPPKTQKITLVIFNGRFGFVDRHKPSIYSLCKIQKYLKYDSKKL